LAESQVAKLEPQVAAAQVVEDEQVSLKQVLAPWQVERPAHVTPALHVVPAPTQVDSVPPQVAPVLEQVTLPKSAQVGPLAQVDVPVQVLSPSHVLIPFPEQVYPPLSPLHVNWQVAVALQVAAVPQVGLGATVGTQDWLGLHVLDPYMVSAAASEASTALGEPTPTAVALKAESFSHEAKVFLRD
jgi:hypothetical protein